MRRDCVSQRGARVHATHMWDRSLHRHPLQVPPLPIPLSRYIDAFRELAKSSTTMLLPSSASDPAAMVAQAMAIFNRTSAAGAAGAAAAAAARGDGQGTAAAARGGGQQHQAGGGGAYADAAVYLDATGILARHCGMHIYTYIGRDLNPARR